MYVKGFLFHTPSRGSPILLEIRRAHRKGGGDGRTPPKFGEIISNRVTNVLLVWMDYFIDY